MKSLGHRYCNFTAWVNSMALRSFDSQTRLGIPRPPKSERHPQPAMQGEQYADEGTLILEPSSPASLAPSSFIPPPPPSSMRPRMVSVPPPSSVRPPMPSWDDRSGWAPASTNEVTKSTRIPSKSEHSASAMVLMATLAMLAALVSIGFMHKAKQASESEAPAAAAAPPPVVSESNAAVLPAAPVAPPAQTIDMDDEVKPAAPVAAAKPAVAPQAAPVVRVAAPAQTATPAAAAAPPKPAKEKTPSQTAQQKALEDLLDQLGEEQLKR